MEIFEFFIGMCDKESGVFRKYEDCFIKVCDDKVILIDNFFEFIIVGEKLKLDKFLLFVIILVFKCYFRFLKNCVWYNVIFEDIKNKINEKRVFFFEDYGNNCNVNLWM